MSRRYGRNQRRRAREQIASLTEAYTREAALLADVSDKRRRLEDEIAEAKRRAAHLSVIFAPRSIETGQQRAGRLQWLVANLPNVMSLVSADDPIPLTRALHRVPLELLIDSVSPGVMDEALHARVAFSGREVRYGVSRFAIESLRRRDVAEILAREIAPPMTRNLAEQLKARHA